MNTLCWKCEKPIGKSFNKFMYDGGVKTKVCDKHATHMFKVEDGVVVIKPYEPRG